MDLTPSSLNETHKTLVIDASVLINLFGTECPGLLLRSLNRIILIDTITLNEVRLNPITRKSCEEELAQLKNEGLLSVIQMDEEAYELFIGLTGSQTPDDLDDGEAATLAQAACSHGVAVIDERKATRIAASHIPAIHVLNSIDILASPELLHKLGKEKVRDMIYGALRNARMRVPVTARAWIADLLGVERVKECLSFGPMHRNGLVFRTLRNDPEQD
jgi:predicted nucleic acid-binding protein